ncbi:Tumor necrosis factor receptor superfamily member 5 [Oryzias melastigma]|uniref:Tumor necrosis factor receptor superfamily member 5 n=1 Tax=Oryzias melastigma TaxID=30732 RepID=A0A834FJ57_ORYME|nr:Tumor necrosis factor receptor superfamily member 5 [Oryzias melastigma]
MRAHQFFSAHRMGFVQYFVALWLLAAQLVFTFPTDTGETDSQGCLMCSAGTFQKSCAECEPCSAGSYTSTQNNEDSCHLCFRDCSPTSHLRVVKNCTSTSDLRCECEPGYRCTERVPHSKNCRQCQRITVVTTPGKPKQASFSGSPSRPKPCQALNCGLQATVGTTTMPVKANPQLAAILSSSAFLGFVALIILLCIYRPTNGRCLRQTITKLCNEKRKDMSQPPRDSYTARQQPPSAANMGPVYVHNPGTVIFSLLNQFTGQVGPTISGKRAERTSNEEEEERNCPVFHPASSPGIHFSEEERSGEVDNIFFPSQEQGKDCHISKEEAFAGKP